MTMPAPLTEPSPQSSARFPDEPSPASNDDGPADRWLTLDGVVNARDSGGLRAPDGRRVVRDRLLRSDNLQDLSPRDVTALLRDHGVSDVLDLRSDFEVDREGPGPLVATDVHIHHLSLLPEAPPGTPVDRLPSSDELLPWQEGTLAAREKVGQHAAYLGYLEDRPDSVVAALKVIGSADGAVLVHCAAGKDRTGMIVALALEVAGVDRDEILDDYALTDSVIPLIAARLLASPTYAGGVDGRDLDTMRPRRATMELVLNELDANAGGVQGWLAGQPGWTHADDAAITARLGLSG